MITAASTTMPYLDPRCGVALLLVLAPWCAQAQDAARGDALYRALPGNPGVGSCISCHGEPVNNRNSVLRGGVGAALISRTITAVGAMGYLRQVLTDADLGDIAAYLASIVPAGAIDTLPELSPTTDQFGAQLVGTQSAERVLLLRNRLPRNDISIGAVLSTDAAQFPLQHDCPLALPPLAQCHIRVAFRPTAAGAVSAGLSVVDSAGALLRSGVLAGQGVEQAPPRLDWREPPALAFGNVSVGASAERTARLVNPSASPVQLQRLRLTGPNASRFLLAADCAAPALLPAQGVCELRVRFAPSTAGLAEAWVEIESDASNAPLARVSASGVNAAQEPTPPPSPPPPPPEGGGGATSLAWLALLSAAVAALSKPLRCRSGRRRSS
jgi:cytochrome c553